MASYGKILCHGPIRLTYVNLNGVIVTELKGNIESTGLFLELIVHNDGEYALIRSGYYLMLIYISDNSI